MYHDRIPLPTTEMKQGPITSDPIEHLAIVKVMKTAKHNKKNKCNMKTNTEL